MTDQIVRILLVDDQQLLRRGLTLLLSTVTGIEVVAEAAHGGEALVELGRQPVDLVLTDARMPVMDGVALVVECARRFPEVPVLLLTTFDDDALVQGALAAGAAGFLLKDTSTEALAAAIHAAAGGGLVIDPRVARAAVSPSETHHPLAVLTAAERAVAERVAKGMTNGEIAEELFLAEGTVKNHVSSLLRKLAARDRTALALSLYQALGLRSSGPERD